MTPPFEAHTAFIVDDLAGMVEKAIAAGLRVTEDEPIGAATGATSTIPSATGSS
ncbi:MAG: hypothetical protein WB689_14235 [Xanthobacteraceae bacterium]|jgi:hypothetical protein